MILKLTVDYETAKKLYELKKRLTDICYSINRRNKNKTIVKIHTREEIHVYNYVGAKTGSDYFDYYDTCKWMVLKVYFKNTNSDKNNKLKNTDEY